MTKRERYVFSFSCDEKLINDIEYMCNTAAVPMNRSSKNPINRSRIIEKKLRDIIPRRDLSNSS